MIYIICPTHIATGGTELLHQLHYALKFCGIESSMFYIGKIENSEVQKKFFSKYMPKISYKIDDSRANYLICPETHFTRFVNYRKITKICWRLSVDNFCGLIRKKEKNINKIKHFIFGIWFRLNSKKFIHMVQSEYAKNFVHNKFNIPYSDIYELSDYLSDDYLNINLDNENITRNNTRVLYNPRKGLDFTERIIKSLPNLDWVPLQGFNNKELISLYQHSKLYIDFGNHPGKDRIPREAVLCGCCLITGKNGSAGNNKDVPIDNKYKFDTTNFNIENISKRILDILQNYDSCKNDFDNYRCIIKKEKNLFFSQTKQVFNEILSLDKK